MEKETVDLRRLRYFIAVCEHGGFSRASSSVGIAQPSLTRQIKLLERELGVPLIHRTGRGAGPTTEGRLLLDRSKPHLNQIDEVVRQIRTQASKLSGQVTLGVCPTIAPLFVEDLKSGLEEAHPLVRMTVVEAYSGDLASLMEHGSIDISITYSPSARSPVSFTELLCEPLVLVTPPGGFEDHRPRTLQEISRLSLILPGDVHELRRIIDAAARQRGIALEPAVELNSLGAVKSMLLARSAGHATILPLNSVSEEVAAGRLATHEIADPAMRRTIAVVVPRQNRNEALTDAVATLIQRKAATLASTSKGRKAAAWAAGAGRNRANR